MLESMPLSIFGGLLRSTLVQTKTLKRLFGTSSSASEKTPVPTKRVKKKAHENLTDSNIKHVMSMLNGKDPITKKGACEMLNISYNTARLNNIIQQYEEKMDFTEKRRSANRGKPAEKLEISQAVLSYLEGGSIAEIAKSLYRSPSFVKSIIERLGVPTRRKKDERQHPLFLPEECVAEDFEVGERVWSASYDAPAQVGGRLDDSIYMEKYGSPCYKIYVFEKVDTSNSWFPGVEVGGFNACCLAYDLGKLSHLAEAGVDLQRI